MRQKVDQFDWAATPLGPRASWPPELATVVAQVLDSHFPKALCWGPDLITIYNDAFRPILGDKPAALGRPFSEVWAEVWSDIGPIAQRAMEGTSTFIENYPLIIDRGNGPEQAYFTFCYGPLRLADGSVGGMLDTVMETTDTMRTQLDLQLANQELAHRLKNTLAMVSSIARQTMGAHVEPPVYASFASRIKALGHAHSLLLRQNWAAGSLRETIAGSLEPHADARRLKLSGPDLPVGSRATVGLSMLFHELATNATKYGALSAPFGSIELTWRVDDQTLRFEWREVDGPPVREPARRGFGSRLLKHGLDGEGTTQMLFEQDGLRFHLDLPVSALES